MPASTRRTPSCPEAATMKEHSVKVRIGKAPMAPPAAGPNACAARSSPRAVARDTTARSVIISGPGGHLRLLLTARLARRVRLQRRADETLADDEERQARSNGNLDREMRRQYRQARVGRDAEEQT